MVLGVGLVLGILLEIALIPERSLVEVLYLGLGVALILLPLAPAFSTYLLVGGEARASIQARR